MMLDCSNQPLGHVPFFAGNNHQFAATAQRCLTFPESRCKAAPYPATSCQKLKQVAPLIRDHEIHLVAGIKRTKTGAQIVGLGADFARKDRAIQFEKLALDFADYQTDLKVKIKTSKGGKLSALSINGTIDGAMSPKQLLGFWPKEFALGARKWIVRAVKTAKLGNFQIAANLDETDFANGFIANEHLNMRFDVNDADVQFMNHLPPLRDAHGYGTLQGNSMDFRLTSGNVDGLIIKNGVVTMPRLTPKGGDLNMDLDAIGTVSEMMRVSNFPPFEFATKCNNK